MPADMLEPDAPSAAERPADTTAEIRPSCPRCGYDLAGHASGWSEKCPLAGLCPECGLDFRWGDLLNPALRNLPWLYEHAPRWWSLRAWFATTIRVALPWYFWKRVELHHRVVPQRLGMWVAIVFATPMLLALIVSTAAMLSMWGIRKFSPPAFVNYKPINAIAGPTLLDLNARETDFTITRDGVSVTIPLPNDETNDQYTASLTPRPEPVLVHTDLGPVLMIFNRHFRGWRQVPEAELLASIDNHFLTDDSASSFTISGPTRDSFFSRATRWVAPDGLVMPADIIVVNVSWTPNPGRFSLRDSALGPLGVIVGGSFGAEFGGDGALPYVYYSGNDYYIFWDSILAPPIAFLLVAVAIVLASPTEWRRAHVRSSHLARIAAYSLLPVGVMMLALSVTVTWAFVGYVVWYLSGAPTPFIFPAPSGLFVAPDILSTFVGDGSHFTLAAITALWCPVWWWFALRRGVRLRRVWPLWFFVTTGGCLAALNALLYLDGFTPGY